MKTKNNTDARESFPGFKCLAQSKNEGKGRLVLLQGSHFHL